MFRARVIWALLLLCAALPCSAQTFQQLASRASAAAAANRFDDAIRLYRRALVQKPSWAEGWWQMGSLLYEKDQYGPARDAFAKLVKLTPEAGPAFAMLGLCDFQLKRYDAAAGALVRARALGLGPNADLRRVALYHEALLENRSGHPELALKSLEGIITQEDPTPALLDAFGLAALRMKMLPDEIPAAQRDLVRLAGTAQAQMTGQNRLEARKALDALVAAYPNEPGVHYLYGVYLLPIDSKRANQELEAEIRISPSDPDPQIQIAFDAFRQGEYERAVRFAQKAVELAPVNFVARNILGRALLANDDVEGAIVHLESGVRLAPDSPDMHFALSQAYARAGRAEDAARERAQFEKLDAARKVRRKT